MSVVVDNHVLDVLFRVDSEVLIPIPLQRRHVLRVALQRLGDTIPFDDLLDRHRSSVEAIDGVLETVEYSVRRSSRVEQQLEATYETFEQEHEHEQELAEAVEEATAPEGLPPVYYKAAIAVLLLLLLVIGESTNKLALPTAYFDRDVV